MTLKDCEAAQLPEILAILNHAIEHTTAVYEYRPRTLAQMSPWWQAKLDGRFPVLGAFDGAGALCGFATYGVFRDRPGYKYTVEHSVYVKQGMQGQGLGKRLLAALIERAKAQDYHSLVGGIDASNTVSIRLHEAFGFKHVGTLPETAFKFGRWLDLAFYQLILPTPKEPRDG